MTRSACGYVPPDGIFIPSGTVFNSHEHQQGRNTGTDSTSAEYRIRRRSADFILNSSGITLSVEWIALRIRILCKLMFLAPCRSAWRNRCASSCISSICMAAATFSRMTAADGSPILSVWNKELSFSNRIRLPSTTSKMLADTLRQVLPGGKVRFCPAKKSATVRNAVCAKRTPLSKFSARSAARSQTSGTKR